jgi:hypothetical protein
VFWTVPIKPSGVNVEADAQTAIMKVHELEVEDYFNLVNALVDGPSNEAEVTFTVKWSGFIKEDKVVDPTNDFRAKLIEDSAWVEWKAKSEGITYRSVGDPTTVVFAEFGRERNGTFFP